LKKEKKSVLIVDWYYKDIKQNRAMTKPTTKENVVLEQPATTEEEWCGVGGGGTGERDDEECGEEAGEEGDLVDEDEGADEDEDEDEDGSGTGSLHTIARGASRVPPVQLV